MCGIIGYIGDKQAKPLIMDGLKRLEYRGYDSSGIALITEAGELILEKKMGKIEMLENHLKGMEINSTFGVGHTRWATHGKPTDINAHPHMDCKHEIVVAHNGIIENFKVLKDILIKKGHKFISDTDTEVLVHLIEEFYKDKIEIEVAVRYALQEIEGTFGIVVISKREPDKIICARNSSPIVIGVGEDENFIASDTPAILGHTKRMVYLDDDEIAIIKKDSFRIINMKNVPITKEVQEIEWSIEQAEKGGYPHFMLKEIFEQPDAIHNTMLGHLMEDIGDTRLGGFRIFSDDELRDLERIIIIACGTSWHAALIGKYLIEQFARIPVDVDYASEFRYRNPVINKRTLIFVISQSGETLDTLAAMREAQNRGGKAFGIVNVVGSTIARESDCGVYTHAGPEIGVASTKAFTSQLTALILIAIFLGRKRNLSLSQGKRYINELKLIPDKINKILENTDSIKQLAKKFFEHNNSLYLGRGYNFPIALEGALKLKEISYIHAEGYPAAEMKHGPIALIDKNMPVVFIAPKDSAYEKIVGNINEVMARDGIVMAVSNEGDEEIAKHCDEVLFIPETIEEFTPLLTVIPLQLLAYYIAVLRNCDVDKPRNLAKSVTVE
ncbi:glutamine--fructose-6-phosphate transaminase (isomerizing) [Candidatus Dependentiae bacterium]|nr:glutamine--fructose-6-phosphate transaminase (isomerizing) [Candidatus Dependentiae bacterium]